VVEQLLHGADVVAVLEQVRREAVAQRVAAGTELVEEPQLPDGLPTGFADGPGRARHRSLLAGGGTNGV